MFKIISKVIFWSALAFFFYVVTGSFSTTHAADDPITISDVYYNPSVSDDTGLEWLKIYNPNETSYDLSGYDLYFGHYYTFNTFILAAKETVTIHINLTDTDSASEIYTGTENQGNMGDSYGTVALFKNNTHSASTIVDFVQYGSSGHTWQSAAVLAGIWTTDDFVAKVDVGHAMKLADVDIDNNLSTDWADTIIQLPVIKEESVVLADEEEIAQISIVEARQKQAGEYASVTGVITILPSILSDQYFYIEDTSGGIQIYCYKKDFPSIALGDLVSVTGQIGDYYTDKRLKISDASNIKILGKSDLIEPKKVVIDQIDDSFVGQVVEFEGEVSNTSGNTFYLEGSGEIKISIKEQTNIDKPRMQVGDKVRIIGVVAKYKNNYQVLPFDQAGVTILTSGKLPSSGKRDINLSKSILILSLWKLSPKAKRKLKNLLKTMPKV